MLFIDRLSIELTRGMYTGVNLKHVLITNSQPDIRGVRGGRTRRAYCA